MNKNIFLVLSFSFSQIIFAQGPTQQWLSKYNGIGDYSDKFNSVKVDGTGNIYAAGYTVRSENKKDFLTVKMNSAGDTLWTRTMNGTDKKDDEALHLIIDNTGNVYVTGVSKGATSEDDYLTIAYNSSGAVLWSASYNYANNQDEQPSAIALDAAGNIYVTGKSDNDPSGAVVNDDYATVKYSPTGVQLWAVRYNGTGNGTDRATGMAVSSGGNVYITGRSDNGTDDDFVTIKYTANGVQSWLKTLDKGDKEKAEVLTIDASENVYVSGRADNGSDNDYLTVKYDSNGSILWTGGVIYSGGFGDEEPTAIAVDGSGNVYLTGVSDGDITAAVNFDFATIKYNSSGVQQWAQRYNGSGNGNDSPSGIAIDGTGKVIVCGQTDTDAGALTTNNNSIVISYSNLGVQSWLMTHNGTSNLSDGANAIDVDAAGTIYLAGNADNLISQKDGLVIKYSTTGTQTWLKTYNGKGDHSDNVNKIVVDPLGNSYLAGYTYNAGTERDLFVCKLDPSGILLWSAQYNGTSNNSDEAMDVVVDASGNVYITGYTKENISDYNYITRKYSPTGTLLWSTQYNNITANLSDKASHILIDDLNNVYVTGTSDASAADEDIVTLKYNSVGIQQWVKRHTGGNGIRDKSVDFEIKTDAIYVLGSGFNGQFTILKYNYAGVLQFLTYSQFSTSDKPEAMAIDANGNIFIAGSKNSSTDEDFITAKLSPTGTPLWSKTQANPSGNDKVYDIAIDAAGNSYVTGKTSNGVSTDIRTIKYDPDGVQAWMAIYNGAASANDVPSKIKIDANGDVLIAGESDNGNALNPNTDFCLLKYNSNGTQIWIKNYDGPDHLTDGINTIAFDNTNNIFVSGNSASIAEQKNIVTIKYDSPVGIDELNFTQNRVYVFPNPFNNQATISISSDVQLGENTTFVLYDLRGNIIKKIAHITEPSFQFNRENIGNGMYIYQLKQDGKIVTTGKLTII
jgi:uncharacterized delta-60 repeat protein